MKFNCDLVVTGIVKVHRLMEQALGAAAFERELDQLKTEMIAHAEQSEEDTYLTFVHKIVAE